jgi:hypothetical protein
MDRPSGRALAQQSRCRRLTRASRWLNADGYDPDRDRDRAEWDWGQCGQQPRQSAVSRRWRIGTTRARGDGTKRVSAMVGLGSTPGHTNDAGAVGPSHQHAESYRLRSTRD